MLRRASCHDNVAMESFLIACDFVKNTEYDANMTRYDDFGRKIYCVVGLIM